MYLVLGTSNNRPVVAARLSTIGCVIQLQVSFNGSILIMRGWGCGFGNNREDSVARSGTYPPGPFRKT
jgi:hypothetical protein